MKRGGYIERRTRLKPRRAKPRRSGRARDAGYLEAVRRMRCLMDFTAECEGRIHAHHAGPRPMGRKASDDTAIPLCALHHDQWHGGKGPFRGWTRAERRNVADQWIAQTQAAASERRAA